MEKKYITIKEAAKLFGVSVDSIRRWSNEGKLKPIKTMGNHRRFDLAELEAILESSK